MGSKGKTEKTTYALFHGSPNSNISEFDLNLAGRNTSSGEKFLFFTDSRQMADDFSYERLETSSMFFNRKGQKGRVYEVEVTMKHPLDMTNPTAKDTENLIKMSNGELDKDMVERFSKGNNQLIKAYIDLDKIASYGYDGFIAKMDRTGAKEYAVLSPKQAKIVR